MTGKAALADRLFQIVNEAGQFETGWRRIGPVDQASLLAHFVAVIDETVLPRRLALRNQNGEILCLEAANRRLRRFVAPVPDNLLAHGQLFVERVLDVEDPSLAQIGAMLGQHFSGSTSVFLQSTELSVNGPCAQAGVSANDLVKAWSISPVPGPGRKPEEAIERFRHALAGNCAAWVHLRDGHIAASSDAKGADDLLERSHRGGWQNVPPCPGVPKSNSSTPKCLILGTSADPAACTILIDCGIHHFILSVAAISANEIAMLWRREGF